MAVSVDVTTKTNKHIHTRGPREGQARRSGPPPPDKSQKYRVSYQYWFGTPEKSQSYQARLKLHTLQL